MKKGQLFILSAFIIAISLGILMNLSFFSSLPIQEEKSLISSLKPLSQNIETELIYLLNMDPDNFTNIDNFISFIVDHAQEKNFVSNILRSTSNSSIDPSTCDVFAWDSTSADFTSYTDFNIILRSSYYEEISNSYFRMCWK